METLGTCCMGHEQSKAQEKVLRWNTAVLKGIDYKVQLKETAYPMECGLETFLSVKVSTFIKH